MLNVWGFTYLSEGDSAVLVLVHFLNNLGGFLVADVETARLNEAAELLTSDSAIIVHVERVECLIHIEVGLTLEALADRLSSDLTAEVLSPDGAELQLGVGEEAVITAVERVAVVRATTLSHAGVVSIKGEESVAELTHVEAAVTSGVVTSHEEVELLASGEDTDGGETLAEISDSDATEVVDIKDLEGIRQVEVGLESKRGLLTLDLILGGDKVAETVDELILIAERKDGLPGGARVAGEGLGRRGASR